MLGEAGRVDPPPHHLDVMRILAFEIAFEDILDQARDKMRIERHAVRLPYSLHTAVRDELDEHEVATAVMRRRIADDEGLNVGKLHAGRFLQVDVSSGRTSAAGVLARRPGNCRASKSALKARTPASGTG